MPEGYEWKRNSDGSLTIEPNLDYDPRTGKFTDPETGEVITPDGSLTTQQKGVIGEQKADDYMTQEEGMNKIGSHGDKPQGIDGVYENPNPPPKYVVVEAKYGTSQLGDTESSGKQMGDRWVEDRLEAAVNDEVKLDDIIIEGYEKWLIRYDPKTGQTTKKVIPHDS